MHRRDGCLGHASVPIGHMKPVRSIDCRVVTNDASWIECDEGGPARVPGSADALHFGEAIANHARDVLARDGTHASMMFFHIPSEGWWHVFLVGFADAGGKVRLWQELGELASKAGYDAFVFVGEAWSADERDVQDSVNVRDAPSVGDELLVVAEAKDGATGSWVTPFRRTADEVELGPTHDEHIHFRSAGPIRAAWGTSQG
jgi:hypothetical protein